MCFSIVNSSRARIWIALYCVCAAGCTPSAPTVLLAPTQGPTTTVEPVHPVRLAGEDWPQFLGPRGDGTSIEKGLDPQLWKPHPPLVWTLQLGTSYAGPTISQGRLFQADRFGNVERLTCFAAETGKELWRYENAVQYEDLYGYNNGPRCCPVIDGDRVYVYGVAGNLVCVAVQSGQLHWKKDLAREYGVVQNFFGVASTPCVSDGLLIVAVGGSPSESQSQPAGRLDLVKSNGSAIVALDKLTGREVYKVGNDLASYSTPMVRKLDGQLTGLAFLRGGLLGWEPSSGKERFYFPWRAEMLESVNAAQPIVLGKQIFVSETYEIGSVLLQVDGNHVTTVWKDADARRDKSFRAHWATPVVIDGYLYGCSGRNEPDSDFRCVRLSDGHVQWAVRRHERSSVLSVDGYLVVLGENGHLELIRPNPEKPEVIARADLSQINDPRDGQPLLEPPCWAAPVLSHGLMYIRGNTKLLCLELIPDGR